MKRNVWVVEFDDEPYAAPEWRVVGAFSTHEKAEQYVKRNTGPTGLQSCRFRINKTTLNKEEVIG